MRGIYFKGSRRLFYALTIHTCLYTSLNASLHLAPLSHSEDLSLTSLFFLPFCTMHFTSLPKAWNASQTHARTHTHPDNKNVPWMCWHKDVLPSAPVFFSKLGVSAGRIVSTRQERSQDRISFSHKLEKQCAHTHTHRHTPLPDSSLPALNNHHCSLLYALLKDRWRAQKRANEGGKEGDTNVIFSIGADLWLALVHHFLWQAGRTRLDSSGQMGGWRMKSQGHG